MGLEDLLKKTSKSVVALDEAVLKCYTVLSKHWSTKQLYSVSMGLNLTATAAIVSSFPLYSHTLRESFYWATSCTFYFISSPADFWYNVHGISGKIKEDITNDTRADSVEAFSNRFFRFPLFLTGFSHFAYSFYNMRSSFINDTKNINYNIVFCGLGCLLLASSMYLKDRDPKLLDKNPFWKRVYGSMKEKVAELLPEPVPQPNPGFEHGQVG